MAFDNLKWWTCDYCSSPLFYTPHDDLTELIAGHFQRCPAVHLRLAAMYLRMAEKETENNHVTKSTGCNTEQPDFHRDAENKD
jgi:hypothetical protein